MWIVRLALRRPYTFAVMAILIVILGAASIVKHRTDVFPDIDIPVISIIWQYNGMPPDQMAKYITTFSEFTVSSGAQDVRAIESTTLYGSAVVRVFFQPDANVDAALSQITALSQTIIRRMPPGTVPPLIIRYSASSVPILQLGLASNKLNEAQLYDFGRLRIRTLLGPVRGARLPLPYGGRPRAIMVDLDPQAMQALSITGADVTNALALQNLNLPSGTVKVDSTDYLVSLNSNPLLVEQLNDVPIKLVNGAMVYVRDVAQVRDGYGVQTNVVRADGRRSALITILKHGTASTIDVVNGVRDILPKARAIAPDIEITELFDQSVFVKSAINGVILEGVIAAGLTALMILLFLGSWRSTLIVTVSIPLSVLVSVTMLYLTGHSLNLMTLGGLALAVGVLVDDATVTIENIHRHLAMGKTLEQAIYDGSEQITLPALVSTLAICIVFVPVVFLDGPAKFLFIDLALAVVYAMLASYLLSRTLVPVMVKYIERHDHHHEANRGTNLFARIHHAFDAAFNALRSVYLGALRWSLGHRTAIFVLFGAFGAISVLTAYRVGKDFFPEVDAGQIRLHVVAPIGTRLERTEEHFAAVEAALREIIKPGDLGQILDNIGAVEPVNLAFSDNVSVSSADGEILISLQPERTTRAPDYVAILRRELPKRFPELRFYFQPADIVSQILNFGLPAPINVMITGRDPKNYKLAADLADELRKVQGAVDVRVHQSIDAPSLQIDVDRQRAAELGMTQREVANNVLIGLSSSALVTPNLWPDPKTGTAYPITVQTPQHRLTSIDDVMSTLLPGRGAVGTQLLANVATVNRQQVPAIISHYDIANRIDVFANVEGRDLGAVATEVDTIVGKYCTPELSPVQRFACDKAPSSVRPGFCPKLDKNGKEGPRCAALEAGSEIRVRGQIDSMRLAFDRMSWGMVAAALLVYFLLVVNFQSWSTPFIIVTALPGALCGIVWALFGSGSTFSVPALMGSIMVLGVATANSILLIAFAEALLREGKNAFEAALEAGFSRLRPVLMTASAMVIGMIPMALGLGDGGEQNAPLGRAVIGGLIAATISTLIFVPVVFTLLRARGRPLESAGNPAITPPVLTQST